MIIPFCVRRREALLTLPSNLAARSNLDIYNILRVYHAAIAISS